MQIDIQARGFKLTVALRNYVERRLRFAVGSVQGSVRRISVRLSDENGPHGGIDMRCRIRASLPASTPVVIEDTEADLYVAIDRAVDRLSRSVARRIERLRGNRRSSRPLRGGAGPLSKRNSRSDAPVGSAILNDEGLPA